MKAIEPASHDAIPRLHVVHGGHDVRWLRSREPWQFQRRRRRLVGALSRRLALCVSVGLAINVGAAGMAVAPSTTAWADVGPSTLDQRFRVAIAPVEAAPIPIPPDADDAPGPDAPEPDGLDTAEINREDVRRLLARAEWETDPNELLEFGGVRVPRYVVEAILRASEATGVDPVYMMALADKESSFDVDVKARTSSAEGLFQFIVPTWLEAVRQFGPRHGLAEQAAAIVTVDGEPMILDRATREYVLGLRRDPYVAAVMAAELTKRHQIGLSRRMGRKLDRTEYYLAHFFGVSDAGRFMKLLDGRPKQIAPRLFPHAARANRPLFFVGKGKTRQGLTVAEVYRRLDRMIDSRVVRYRGVTNLVAPVSTGPAL
jgi:hypothetical protein